MLCLNRALQRLKLYDLGKTKRQKYELNFAFLGFFLLKAKALSIEKVHMADARVQLIISDAQWVSFIIHNFVIVTFLNPFLIEFHC